MPQALQVLGSPEPSPLWSHRDATEEPKAELKQSTPALSEKSQKIDRTVQVPDEPWVTLVLSGGVFRGVFQIGVLSALQQSSVQPKLFAGASVGSIMAAMAAKLFTVKDGTLELQRLAATFIALDRLVVTDRLADFVRRFLVRANDVRISPRNLDHFLRRLDQPNAGAYSKNARTVLAGSNGCFSLARSSRGRSSRLFTTRKPARRHNCFVDTAHIFLSGMAWGWNCLVQSLSDC